jgi:hypothetical protein
MPNRFATAAWARLMLVDQFVQPDGKLDAKLPYWIAGAAV